MKKKIVVTLYIIVAIIVVLFIVLMYFISPPDKSISTPSQVRQIIIQEIPSDYELESIRSIQRISEFEDEHRPMKWLVLTLKYKTITDEKEMYKIAEPICKGLLKNNTGYEGLDINPHTTLRRGVNCSAWGA